MSSRTFTADDQLTFARLSGDFNEQHVDPVHARRTLFGGPVVHGINMLLWSLDASLKPDSGKRRIAKLKALFIRELKVNEQVRIVKRQDDGVTLKYQLETDQAKIATIMVRLEPASADAPDLTKDELPPETESIDQSLSDIAVASGRLDLYLARDISAKLYPNLTTSLLSSNISVLLASTRVVGTFCPGKYSVYSELELQADENQCNSLTYAAQHFDDRFDLLSMTISGPQIAGVLRAFRRPPPQAQADYQSSKKAVNASEFANQRALVIGGSRGLGEVVVKLLCAGGADVKFTFRHGSDEAEKLLSDIHAGGSNAATFPFDVLNPAFDEKVVSADDWFPTHLYYFATPFITANFSAEFSLSLFDKFCAYYLTGLIQTLNCLGPGKIQRIFSPSSALLNEAPAAFGEYVAAKAAAEVLAAHIENSYTGTRVYEPRLPRLATDQTANLRGLKSGDPVPVMLAELHNFLSL